MEALQQKPKPVVSRSGVLQVSPAEIFNSQVGRAEIRKTAELNAARNARKHANGRRHGNSSRARS